MHRIASSEVPEEGWRGHMFLCTNATAPAQKQVDEQLLQQVPQPLMPEAESLPRPVMLTHLPA